MLIYVSGPYTKGDQIRNVRRAIAYGDWLRQQGHLPFIPHLTALWHMVLAHDWKWWLDYDTEMLARIKPDEVHRLSGESAGADRECELAKRLGIKVVEVKGW